VLDGKRIFPPPGQKQIPRARNKALGMTSFSSCTSTERFVGWITLDLKARIRTYSGTDHFRNTVYFRNNEYSKTTEEQLIWSTYLFRVVI
jgi:hypothetical protein